jgi:PleD family two-component response regulator
VGDVPFRDDAGPSLRQTVSIGVATWDGRESADDLLHRADMALYAAKGAGRDRVSTVAAAS